MLSLTRKKIEEILATGNDIAVPILTLVNEFSGVFPPLQLAAGGALFIAEKVKVSTMYPDAARRYLPWISRGFGRTIRPGRNLGST